MASGEYYFFFYKKWLAVYRDAVASKPYHGAKKWSRGAKNRSYKVGFAVNCERMNMLMLVPKIWLLTSNVSPYGIEPETTPTLRGYHTPRPSQL